MEREGLPIRILFVCTGNICRSPMAEGMLRHILEAENMTHQVMVDSAGTSNAYIGWQPHLKAQSAMRARGIDISNLRARQVTAKDLGAFDRVIALDIGTQRFIQMLANETNPPNVELLMELTEDWPERSVPDPLLTNISFDVVLGMIEDACFDLFHDLKQELSN